MTRPTDDASSLPLNLPPQWYDSLPGLVWMADANGDTTFVNQAWVEFTGTPRGEALGFSFAHAVHEDDREAVLTRWATAMQTGGIVG